MQGEGSSRTTRPGIDEKRLYTLFALAAWALYFLPLESYLAGVFLLLVFYLTSGLVQHHLNDDLHAPVIAEFSLISVIGVLIVTVGRLLESS